MSQKLTGREAVKALMDGKKVKNPRRTVQLKGGLLVDEANYSWSLSDLLKQDDWEIVPEAMMWEGEATVDFHSLDVLTVMVPKQFENKRVKIRIEEIL